MERMFEDSDFQCEISNWDVSNITHSVKSIFNNEYTNKPYWAEIEDESDRKKAIKIYQLHTSLERNLNPAYIKMKR